MVRKILKTRSEKTKKQKSEDSINLDEKIREKAYELYEARGCCHGNDRDDWFEAEKIVRS